MAFLRTGRAETARDLSPGDRVGDYVVAAALEEGGMACVYKAAGSNGQQVALKLIRPEVAGDVMFRRRFEREVEVARRIQAPRVVSVLDVGEHHGVPYMVQPFMEGGSLQGKLDRERRLDASTAVAICLQIAKGLSALHQHRLIHRDLKPANILLDRAGVAHVADFGVAKDPERSLLTEPGQAVGSWHYMAPEQVLGQELTPAADVYALGCLMYECLSGSPPFGSKHGMAVLCAHLDEEPLDLAASSADLPSELIWATSRALEKLPERRPGSATAFARMLQAAARDSPLGL